MCVIVGMNRFNVRSGEEIQIEIHYPLITTR